MYALLFGNCFASPQLHAQNLQDVAAYKQLISTKHLVYKLFAHMPKEPTVLLLHASLKIAGDFPTFTEV